MVQHLFSDISDWSVCVCVCLFRLCSGDERPAVSHPLRDGERGGCFLVFCVLHGSDGELSVRLQLLHVASVYVQRRTSSLHTDSQSNCATVCKPAEGVHPIRATFTLKLDRLQWWVEVQTTLGVKISFIQMRFLKCDKENRGGIIA